MSEDQTQPQSLLQAELQKRMHWRVAVDGSQ